MKKKTEVMLDHLTIALQQIITEANSIHSQIDYSIHGKSAALNFNLKKFKAKFLEFKKMLKEE